MRNRAPPRGPGLLNGHYDKHGGKTARCNRQHVAKLAAAVLVTLFVVVWKHHGASSDYAPSQPLGGYAESKESIVEDHKPSERKKNRSKSRHHKRHESSCTDSPLKEKEVFPIYGCEEMEEMLSGETEYLGRGYWREVRLAEYRGQQVAIKTLRDDQEESKRNKQRHRWEAVALDMVKDHPNIVHVLGLCECDMVTEYFPNYMDVIIMGNPSSDSKELAEIPIGDVIRMALDAARGLQALHEMPGGPVVHADLQPRQLLLDEDGVVKINDLNRCRFMGRDATGKPCPFKISKGNGVWRSPEEYAGEELTEKLDIYSMGNIFWAMLGRDVPFIRDDSYKGKVLSGERPAVDPSWHPEFVELFQSMWQREPEARPSARDVVKRLERMYAKLQGE